MCFVGKATKIFIFIVTVLVVMGLIVGFGLAKRGLNHKTHKCDGGSCDNDSSPSPPGLSPPGPISAGSITAAPVYNSPPVPIVVTQGPVHA
ncbi:hypothetical protein GIB67_039866 [Kingdonia uniflora]|uniref:Uncharacterized protein n=1 Tax=Kingdonia uniflora TaxID=39325 RepID=A0A7J7P3A4_9MAGN|nr:hypothetical protein GIB67_039866 [Kingdonia uniflora]